MTAVSDTGFPHETPNDIADDSFSGIFGDDILVGPSADIASESAETIHEAFFFVPHQDDELLTCGVGIVKALQRFNGRVAVVLCTDGSNCKTRLHLNDGGCCAELSDNHHYAIDAEEYGKLRDI